ncbi:methyl-accepting chemotaxis protein [Rhodobacter sp. JA431]|uniref:methyl-accepting chemotaxis protein n=1 Tax=Rhodobacter sp. JA431 TaxID=570013 RepID=UPI000BDA9270|nr:methyl-accepting chemotaxis protein [Rhodobacter sp. JA431]SOC16021.1 methyl-accepting chemotaxis protein [Rhodobacter sp. JA431]
MTAKTKTSRGRLQSVAAKMFLLQMVTISAMVGIAAIGIWGDTQGAKALHSVHDNSVMPLMHLRQVDAAYVVEAPRVLRRAADGKISWTEAQEELATMRQTSAQEWESYLSTEHSADEEVMLEEAVAAKVTAEAAFSRLEAVARARNSEGQNEAVGAYLEAVAPFTELVEKLEAFQQHEADVLTEVGLARSDMIALLIGGVALGAILLALTLVLMFGARLRKALGAAVGLAEDVAKGDLRHTMDVTSRDEIGDLSIALNDMVERLRVIVNDVSTASRDVATGAEQLSSTAQELNHGATEQATATEEASSSMEEMAASIKQNAQNAGETEAMARKSAEDARLSGSAVTRAVDAMQTIAEKIMVVQEIARQTDLLALNAAVEAARAGEHGRGFAVVASEVRKLAERSQAAAGEISSLSSNTVRAAQEAGDMLAGLVPDIERTSKLVENISRASSEQAAGASQVNTAIQQLDQVTQQNTSAAEQMSSTAEELSGQADQLQAAIGFFRLSDSETGSRRTPSKAAPARKAPAPVRSAPKPAAQSNGGGFDFQLDSSEDDLDASFLSSGGAKRGRVA